MSSSKELKKCSNEKIHFWRHGMVYYFILHILYLKRDTVWWSKDFTWNWLKKNCHYWYICTVVVRWLFAKFAWNARIHCSVLWFDFTKKNEKLVSTVRKVRKTTHWVELTKFLYHLIILWGSLLGSRIE